MALARLNDNGSAGVADLARRESVRPQSMGATLAALEREGLVRLLTPTSFQQAAGNE
ncbi:MAG: MarR family transcriptional regulator [Desulfovibrionaceae bacterium]